MSKAISSYSKDMRKEVITRRLLGNTKGLGYWAVVDAQERIKRESEKK